MSFGVDEDEGDNILSLTDGEGSIVVFLLSTTDVEEGKIDDSSSGQFPLTIVVEKNIATTTHRSRDTVFMTRSSSL